MLERQNNRDWIRQLRYGDEDADQALWEMLYRDGVAVAHKYDQLDDMGYDVALFCYETIHRVGLKQFNFQSSFRSYCWTIMARELFKRLKKEREWTSLEWDVQGKSDIELNPAAIERINERLELCVTRLDERKRAVFDLIYKQDLSVGDAAEQMEITRSNAYQLAWRARRDIRRCLEQFGFLFSDDVLSL